MSGDQWINIWGYLWYVKAMFLIFIAYYLIRYFIKNRKAFVIILFVIFVSASVMHVIPYFYTWSYIRAAMGISLGMLVSYLPKIRLKKQNILWIILIPIQLIIISIFLFENNLLGWKSENPRIFNYRDDSLTIFRKTLLTH